MITGDLSRAERVALVRRTMDENPLMNGKEVAALLGVGYSTMRALLCDPDGSKQRRRRERYRRPCPGCGALMDGSSGYSGGPRLCIACSRRRQHE